MIRGIGTDIVSVQRIEQLLTRHPERGLAHLLHPVEVREAEAASSRERFVAKRFAAKEAAAKALGTGIGRGISFQHFIVSNDPSGRPQLELTGPAKALADSMQVRSVWLSISDEQAYACATVILES